LSFADCSASCESSPAYGSIRQHTSAYVGIRQHTSAAPLASQAARQAANRRRLLPLLLSLLSLLVQTYKY
jgi:hypothetical protein